MEWRSARNNESQNKYECDKIVDLSVIYTSNDDNKKRIIEDDEKNYMEYEDKILIANNDCRLYCIRVHKNKYLIAINVRADITNNFIKNKIHASVV